MLERQLHDLIEYSNSPKSFWKKLKRFTSTFTVQNNITLGQWKDHFESLFKGERVDVTAPIISDDDNIDDVIDEICNGEITEEEIAMSIRALKSDKSPGQNEIPPLFF